MAKDGSSDYKKLRKRWFFKDPLTEWLFMEPKMVLLWHHCEEPFEAPLFLKCNVFVYCGMDVFKGYCFFHDEPHCRLKILLTFLAPLLLLFLIFEFGSHQQAERMANDSSHYSTAVVFHLACINSLLSLSLKKNGLTPRNGNSLILTFKLYFYLARITCASASGFWMVSE